MLTNRVIILSMDGSAQQLTTDQSLTSRKFTIFNEGTTVLYVRFYEDDADHSGDTFDDTTATYKIAGGASELIEADTLATDNGEVYRLSRIWVKGENAKYCRVPYQKNRRGK